MQGLIYKDELRQVKPEYYLEDRPCLTVGVGDYAISHGEELPFDGLHRIIFMSFHTFIGYVGEQIREFLGLTAAIMR